MLHLPQEYVWLEPVLIAAAVVFVVDLIGNMLSFSNRFLNALVTSLVFAAIFGTLSFLAHREGMEVPSVSAPAAAPAPAAPAAAAPEPAPAAEPAPAPAPANP